MANNKIDLQVDQSTWKKSVDEMLKTLQSKVKAAEEEFSGAFKGADNTKKTADRQRDFYDKRVAQEKHRTAQKGDETLLNDQQKHAKKLVDVKKSLDADDHKRAEKLSDVKKSLAADDHKRAKKLADVKKSLDADDHKQAKKLADVKKSLAADDHKQAKKLMQDFHKESEKESEKSSYKRSSLRNLLMGKRSDLGPDGKPTKWSEDFKGVGKTVGHSAIMMAAGKLGGAPGAMVAQNIQDKGLVAGGLTSIVGLVSTGIDSAIRAGTEESGRYRSHGGSFGKLGVYGRAGFGKALNIGEGTGLSRDEAAGYASQLGRAGFGASQITGSHGVMKATALAQRLGLGESSLELLGQANKQVGGVDAPARLLYRAVQAGMKSGLKEGRLPEFFQAVTSIVGGRGVGQKVNVEGSQDFLVGLGRAGFVGGEGLGVAGSLDQLMKGRGSEFANAMSLRAAGLGEQGVGYFDAERKRQRGLFEVNPNSKDSKDTPEERFKALYQQYSQSLGGNKDLISHQISQDTGGKLSMDAVDSLINKMEGGGLRGGDVMKVADKTDIEKQLEAMGSMKDAITIMTERLQSTWRELFKEADFNNAMASITENIPGMAKNVAWLVSGAASVFNFPTDKSSGKVNEDKYEKKVGGNLRDANAALHQLEDRGENPTTLFKEAQERASKLGLHDRARLLKDSAAFSSGQGRSEDAVSVKKLVDMALKQKDHASMIEVIVRPSINISSSLSGQLKVDVPNTTKTGKTPFTTRG